MSFSKSNTGRLFFEYEGQRKALIYRGTYSKSSQKLIKKAIKAGKLINLPFHKKLQDKIIDYKTGLIKIKTGGIIKRNKVLDIENKLKKFKNNEIEEITIPMNVLKLDRAIRTIMKILPNEKVLIRANSVYYTLSDYNKSRLIKSIKDAQYREENATSSDNEVIIEYLNNLTEIKVLKNIGSENLFIDEHENGGYFKYYHKFENMNWERYGIFREYRKGIYDINCLIRAFIEGGMENKKINYAKTFVMNRNIPICKLNEICEKLNISIELYKMKKRNGTFMNNKNYYGDKKNKTYKIGLYDSHYFIYDKETNITKYVIENYDTIRDKEKYNEFYRKNKRSKKRFITSFKLFKLLKENKEKILTEIDASNGALDSQFYDKCEIGENLEYDYKKCCKDVKKKKINRIIQKFDFDFLNYLNNFFSKKYKQYKKQYKKIEVVEEIEKIYWFDFETYTDENKKHIPYLVCAVDENNNKIRIVGKNCGKRFLESLQGDKNLLIAHNAGYDWRFLLNGLIVKKVILKGNGLMSCNCIFKKKCGKTIKINIKDSLKLITMPLRKFGKCFNLKQEKEIMPYNLYNTKDVVDKKLVDLDFALSFVKDENKEQFLKNIKKWDCMNNGKFDCISYSLRYCMIDCIVLKEGYLKFRNWMLEISDNKLDINKIISIASLAHKYLINKGCYDGVYKLSGIPRIFIQKCVIGGRTMVKQNKKIHLKNKEVADYDGVSLYPSAMNRMRGFLKGTPKIIKNLSYNWIKEQDGYFVKIKILKVGTRRQFPLMSFVNEDGVRVFTNDMIGKTIYLDKTSLEDLINFQKVEFEILQGYYFDEGRNNTVNNVIKYLFEERLKKKKENNPIQVVYKLIMNSSYGKSILKPIETEDKFFNNSKKMEKYLQYNYNSIKEIQKIKINENYKKYIIKKIKPINEHFNIAQVGVEILSMSKRIMNEVMCLAEDKKLNMYYTDTDSIHIDYDDVKKLSDEFNKKYNRELTGKNLGQFHIDFDLDKSVGDIKAVESIFLGKKCYIDKLEGYDKEGKKLIDYHIRMKGVPNTTIKYVAYKNYGGDLMKLYKDLYKGKKIKFDLLEGGNRCNFKYNKDMTINSMDKFERELSFRKSVYAF